MMPPPVECRIVAALALQPMASRELAQCLTLNRAHVCHRIAYLRSSRNIQPQCNTEGKRPTIRYALTTKGREWARELIA